MPYVATRFAAPKQQPTKIWALAEFSGGLNLEDLPWMLADSQSPDLKNVWFNGRNLCKRWGYRHLNASAIGSPILSMYPFKYKNLLVFAAGSGLYSMETTLGTVTQLFSGLAANIGSFFKYNGNLYYHNGAQYVVFDGNTATAVKPYIPTVIMNRDPTSGGDTTQNYNRLGAGFKNSFNADGTSTVYQLTDQNLDATATSCTLNGNTLVEGTHYTVNRVTGAVTFSTPPAKGQNNLIITAYKTRQDWVDSILKCKLSATFGGSNDSRIFFAGNGTSNYFWSDVTSPEYWPQGQYNLLNSNDDEITGFGMQNDTLVIFKNRSLYAVSYDWDDTNAKAYFPVVSLNDNIGCDCPGTICLINNRLTWLTSYAGAFTLVNQTMTGTTAGVYRNVVPISRNVNGNGVRKGILQEDNLQSAVAVDFGRKYWIAVNGHVWLWDYGMTPYSSGADLDEAQMKLSWWYFDNLPIAGFAQDGTDLFFGDTASGYIAHFENSFSDNGAAISAYWKLKVNYLQMPNQLKTITKMWISCRSDTATTLQITYYTDSNPDGVDDPQPILITSFDISKLDLSQFYLGVNNWFGEYQKKPPIKNCQAMSVKFSNNNLAEDLNVSNLILAFIPGKEVKRSV